MALGKEPGYLLFLPRRIGSPVDPWRLLSRGGHGLWLPFS